MLYIDKKSGHNFDSGRSGTNYPTAISESARRNNIQQFWNNVNWRDMKNNSGTYTVDSAPNVSPMALAYQKANEEKAKRNAQQNGTALNSIQSLDAEYQEALNANDPDWQAQLVGQAAYEAGYTTGAYHGSPVADITEFS